MNTRIVTEKSIRCISSLPGHESFCVSHDAMVFADQRGRGAGHTEHANGIEEMKKLAYDYAICVVRTDNAAQLKIIEKAGWKRLESYIWTRGCDTYNLYGKTLL